MTTKIPSGRQSGYPRLTHGLTGTPEHKLWKSMTQRCYTESATGYDNYGGRGITVYEEWRGPEGFVKFLQYIGPRPSPKHTIERKDSNGNYEPGNVIWATQAQQMRNTRRTHMLSCWNKTQCILDWSIETGISRTIIYYRLRLQKKNPTEWPIEKVLTPMSRAERNAERKLSKQDAGR